MKSQRKGGIQDRFDKALFVLNLKNEALLVRIILEGWV